MTCAAGNLGPIQVFLAFLFNDQGGTTTPRWCTCFMLSFLLLLTDAPIVHLSYIQWSESNPLANSIYATLLQHRIWKQVKYKQQDVGQYGQHLSLLSIYLWNIFYYVTIQNSTYILHVNINQSHHLKAVVNWFKVSFFTSRGVLVFSCASEVLSQIFCLFCLKGSLSRDGS